MRRIPSLRVLAALVAVLLVATSGASADPEVGEEDTSPYKLASQPVPAVTGEHLVGLLEDYLGQFPMRVTGSPTETAAGQWIHDHAEELGYQMAVEMLPLRAGLPATGPLKAITAYKEGSDPQLAGEVMMFVGHYDSVPQTIDGAYDNGTGTIMMLGLAEALADVDTRRSVMFAWYNGEEEGALASAQHVNVLKARGTDVTIVSGFDMVGIAYPVADPDANANYCLCMFRGGNDGYLDAIQHTVNHEFLEFPAVNNLVRVSGNNTRNSDERNFESAGAVTMRWSGMRTAGSYRAYHMPDDTLETIYDVAGGREFFEAGMANTLRSAYYTNLALDTLDGLPSTF